MHPIQNAEAFGPRVASLDSSVSSVDSLPPLSPARRLYLGPLAPAVELVRRAVWSVEPDQKLKRKIIDCGSALWLEVNFKTGKHRLGANHCESRICPYCRRVIQAETAERIKLWIGLPKRHEYRFITLTLSHSDAPLADQLDFLQESFRRLRQQQIWKRTQAFGKAIIEITYNRHKSQWHPHLHILAKGSFCRQDDLSQAWRLATGGSPIVDIRQVKSQTMAAGYVAKYLGKPPEVGDGPDAAALVAEWYLALKDRKMIISYGPAGPLPELPNETAEDDKPENWLLIMDLDELLTLASFGSAWAAEVMKSLELRNPFPPPLPP